MKSFPSQLQIQNTIVIPETLNTNVAQYVGEVNGKLDSTNLPVQTLEPIKFAIPQYVDSSTPNYNKWKWKGSTQTYYQVSRTSLEHGVDVCDPLYTFDLITGDWNKGWNDVLTFPNFNAMFVEDLMEEGMLSGQVCVDFRHGTNVIQYDPGPPNLYSEVGKDWWTRWGVFINDVLIAESGNVYPQLSNVVIPFSVPIGSQTIRIDVRWMTWTDNRPIGVYTGDPTTALEIFGVQIMARNTFR